MAAKLNLRCKSASGMQIVKDITTETTVLELKKCLGDLCSIEPCRLKIRSGFPPKVIDISNDLLTMNDMPFKSGDTLLVEEDKSVAASAAPATPAAPSSAPASTTNRPQNANDNLNSLWNSQLDRMEGILIRKVVPANNSCLFTSINCCMNDGRLDTESAPLMRDIIVGAVSQQPAIYNDVFLGKPNAEYCQWILKGESWGGAIEVSILSQYYAVEIDVVDTQSGRIDRFGEDVNYPRRIFLLYDGIHYDPLVMEPLDGTSTCKTIFPTADDAVTIQALEIAAECKNSRQFTDTANFDLRCLTCNKPLKGQREAQDHATKTGHTNFGEI